MFHLHSALLNRYGVLAIVAFIAGVLNAAAGGGSFLSFPALLGTGIPPINANATNSVALWPGQVAALVAMRRELAGARGLVVPITVITAVGGIVGALALLHTGQATFLHMVPWLLLFATFVLALSDPARRWLDRLRPERTANGPRPHLVSLPFFFGLVVVSFYIGYFGAGAAFLIYALFAVWGSGISNFHQVNAFKILCNSIANGFAVVTFVLARAVYWREGVLMLLMAIAGGYFGAAYSRRLHPGLLRVLVIATGFAFSIYYFHKVY